MIHRAVSRKRGISQTGIEFTDLNSVVVIYFKRFVPYVAVREYPYEGMKACDSACVLVELAVTSDCGKLVAGERFPDGFVDAGRRVARVDVEIDDFLRSRGTVYGFVNAVRRDRVETALLRFGVEFQRTAPYILEPFNNFPEHFFCSCYFSFLNYPHHTTTAVTLLLWSLLPLCTILM